RKHAQPRAAPEREVPAEETSGRDRKLDQPPAVVLADDVRKALGLRMAVEGVPDRNHARGVAEAALDDDVERPQGARRDREAGRAIAEDRGTEQPLQYAFRTLQIGAERRRRLLVDQAVRVAVGSDLVAGRGDA